MQKNKSFLFLIVLLLFSNIMFGVFYFSTHTELQKTQAALNNQQINERTFVFTQLFLEKVLRSDGEVDFETRLQLENSVRDIGDQEILTQWQKFTESSTETEAQTEVKNLLALLIDRLGAGD